MTLSDIVALGIVGLVVALLALLGSWSWWKAKVPKSKGPYDWKRDGLR